MHYDQFRAARIALPAIMLAASAACSGQSQNGALPTAPQNAIFRGSPNAVSSPPVTAPVTIPYPYSNVYTTTTYASATSKGKATTTTDTGTTTVKFSLDTKTGVYDVPEIIKSKLGYSEILNSAIAFPSSYKGGTAQIILSDNYTYTDGTFVETGTDTYPSGQDSFDFPLTTGRMWSAAAGHLSYANESQPGKKAFTENSSVNENADGTYTGQVSYSSVNGAANQDNYASTTAVALGTPALYTLSERAAGFNQLTQTFDLPSGGKIDVVSSGKKPLPIKRGTAKVLDWYPAPGTFPSTLYSDNFSVTGPVTTPSTCKSRAGVSATEVVENFANLDPVQGFYDTYKATYYLTTLAKGQFWFSCIIEAYANDMYANGWIMSGGSWGGYTQTMVGTETLIAAPVKASDVHAGIAARVPLIPFPSVLFRNRGAINRGLMSVSP
jgi:hypothetical protein